MIAGEIEPTPPSAPDAQVADLLREIIARLESGPAEGLDRAAAAAFVGVSIRKLDELNAGGLMPEPAELGTGNCPRWSRSVLRAWLASGGPARGKWREQQDAAMRRLGGMR